MWEAWPTSGSSSNGGGFDPGNTSFAADLAATSGNTASPVVTSASYNFVAGDVGAWVFVKSGTNWTPGWYKIASVAANAATLTAGVGTAVLYKNLTANTVAGCATVASPTAGTWGVDYSQQAAPLFSYTDLHIDASVNTTLTSAAHPFGKNHVGNNVNISSGTGFTVQTVQIVSVSGTSATVDKSLGTLNSTAGVGKLGGALAASDNAFAIAVGSNTVFLKNTGVETFAGAQNIIPAGAAGAPTRLLGYNLLRGDLDNVTTFTNFPMKQANNVANAAINGSSSTYVLYRNLIVDGGVGGTKPNFGISSTGANTQITNVKVSGGCLTGMNLGGNPTTVSRCYVTGCPTSGTGIASTNAMAITETVVAGNSCLGVSCSNRLSMDSVVIANNSGASSDGVQLTGAGFGCTFRNCNFYNNGRDGVRTTGTPGFGTGGQIRNCIFALNAGYGIDATTTDESASPINLDFDYNAFYSNTSGNRFQVPIGQNDITLTSDPFVNGASNQFALTLTSGGGAACRQVGYPGTFPGISTTGYDDVGACQSQAAGVCPGMIHAYSQHYIDG
jgi:hypothetical protein